MSQKQKKRSIPRKRPPNSQKFVTKLPPKCENLSIKVTPTLSSRTICNHVEIACPSSGSGGVTSRAKMCRHLRSTLPTGNMHRRTLCAAPTAGQQLAMTPALVDNPARLLVAVPRNPDCEPQLARHHPPATGCLIALSNGAVDARLKQCALGSLSVRAISERGCGGDVRTHAERQN